MTHPILPSTTPAPADAMALDQNEAARLTGLSAKTLGRLADAGEPVGRVKVGRRVLFLKSALEAWLAAKAGTGVRK